PCPNGRWFLNPPNLVDPHQDPEHYHRVGPAFFRIGRTGSIPSIRDVGLHAGTHSHLDTTFGCIRMSNHDLIDLLNYAQSNNLIIESLEIPGPAESCSEIESRLQRPRLHGFAADALEYQAERDHIDYAQAFD